jgi:hypothetical protein
VALAGFDGQPPLAVAIGGAASAGEKGFDRHPAGARKRHRRPATSNAIRLKVAQVEQLGGHGFVHCTLPGNEHAMVVQFEGRT